MLENSKYHLCKYWESIHDNMKLHLSNIQASFKKNFYEVEHTHTSPFYEKLSGFVSRVSLIHIFEEFKRFRYVKTNIVICGCIVRTTYELSYACELGIYSV